MHKDTYCPMPFVTLAVNPNNWLTRCMMSNHNMGTIERDTWSNDKFTTLRTDMLAGKWDEEGCRSCWYKETNGQKSRRNRWIDSELKYMGTTNVYENNLSVKRNTIKHLYMNFNNICNFKCRMCGPHYSNAWLPDWNKMQAWEMDESTDKSYTAQLQSKESVNIHPKQQIDIDKFLDEFGPELGELNGIWITGGEPFMDNSVFDFFDKLKQYCDPAQLKVLITTNASKLDVHRLEQLSEFKRLLIHVSIDATGDLYQYMRGYNYTWEQIDAKIKLMHSLQEKYNYTLSLNGTYQIHNMLNLEEFYNWALQFDPIDYMGHRVPAIDWIEHRVLSSPKWLQARHATDRIKLQALAQLNRLRERFPNHQYFDDIAKELNAPADLKYQNKFVTWNKQLDKLRGETYDYNW
jgi:MoaA/NifB/PqqE/SkfB family radical SAM enzyme